jgi:hypothetical protein
MKPSASVSIRVHPWLDIRIFSFLFARGPLRSLHAETR